MVKPDTTDKDIRAGMILPVRKRSNCNQLNLQTVDAD